MIWGWQAFSYSSLQNAKFHRWEKISHFTKKHNFLKKVEMNSLPRTTAYNIQVAQLAYIASVLPVLKLNITKKIFSNRTRYNNTCSCVKCHLRFFDWQWRMLPKMFLRTGCVKHHALRALPQTPEPKGVAVINTQTTLALQI